MPLATTPNSTPDGKPAVHRQLKIQVGAAKRLLKEHDLYRQEAQAQEQKLSKLADENAEEWELKHARRIAEESQRMVKDTRNRLDKAVQELTSFVVRPPPSLLRLFIVAGIHALCLAPSKSFTLLPSPSDAHGNLTSLYVRCDFGTGFYQE
ncbi:tubulin binding cofactor A-domain-containing protein [Pisolithus sp. B1]|nr:tubulin binding cofactor A-domain-containing protein [Pisolithus sp. B1]